MKLSSDQFGSHRNCSLCQSSRPLQNPHIIPEFLYKQPYDKIHRFHIISSLPSKSESFGQKGFREKLLCAPCEQKFARWEKYTKEVLMDSADIRIEKKRKILKLLNLNYRTFRLFLLSLLWRMGVSKLEFFSDVNLGSKHQEILRRALLDEDPLEPLQYPCLMAAVCIKGEFHTDWISQPMHNKSGSYHCHCIVINGILFCFYVSSHAPPADFAKVCISKKGEMSVYVGEIKDIPVLAEQAFGLRVAIRARAKQI
jgi:hypothetical protein